MAATEELLMEPTLAIGPEDLGALRLDLLRRATDVYLGLAYPSGTIPEVVQRRLAWRDECTADVRLTGPPFANCLDGRRTNSRLPICRSARK